MIVYIIYVYVSMKIVHIWLKKCTDKSQLFVGAGILLPLRPGTSYLRSEICTS